MRYGTYKFIEDIITNFEEYPNYIQARKNEIKCHNNVDQKELYELMRHDKQLKELKREQQAIANTFERSSEPIPTMIRLYYFPRSEPLTWHGVAREVCYNRTHCLRLRDEFFNRVADELGMT